MDAIMNKNLKDLRKKYKLSNKKLSPLNIIKFLKSNNRKTENVEWQCTELTKKQLAENVNAVRAYKYKSKLIMDGYLCSTFDPFLFLFAELMEVTIEHENVKKSRCIIKLRSSESHIDCIA